MGTTSSSQQNQFIRPPSSHSPALKTTDGACLHNSRESPSMANSMKETFLNFHPNSRLSFEDKSIFYNSLVSLVKAEYPFDKALQDRAVWLLESLEQEWRDQFLIGKLITKLVPSSTGSPCAFFDSILILLSSPHPRVVAASMSFLNETIQKSSTALQLQLVESDFISNLLAIVQPHKLPLSGNETIFDRFVWIIYNFLFLAFPHVLRTLHTPASTDTVDRCEMIFQKVVLPSSQFVMFLYNKPGTSTYERVPRND